MSDRDISVLQDISAAYRKHCLRQAANTSIITRTANLSKMSVLDGNELNEKQTLVCKNGEESNSSHESDTSLHAKERDALKLHGGLESPDDSDAYTSVRESEEEEDEQRLLKKHIKNTQVSKKTMMSSSSEDEDKANEIVTKSRKNQGRDAKNPTLDGRPKTRKQLADAGVQLQFKKGSTTGSVEVVPREYCSTTEYYGEGQKDIYDIYETERKSPAENQSIHMSDQKEDDVDWEKLQLSPNSEEILSQKMKMVVPSLLEEMGVLPPRKKTVNEILDNTVESLIWDPLSMAAGYSTPNKRVEHRNMVEEDYKQRWLSPPPVQRSPLVNKGNESLQETIRVKKQEKLPVKRPPGVTEKPSLRRKVIVKSPEHKQVESNKEPKLASTGHTKPTSPPLPGVDDSMVYFQVLLGRWIMELLRVRDYWLLGDSSREVWEKEAWKIMVDKCVPGTNHRKWLHEMWSDCLDRCRELFLGKSRINSGKNYQTSKRGEGLGGHLPPSAWLHNTDTGVNVKEYKKQKDAKEVTPLRLKSLKQSAVDLRKEEYGQLMKGQKNDKSNQPDYKSYTKEVPQQRQKVSHIPWERRTNISQKQMKDNKEIVEPNMQIIGSEMNMASLADQLNLVQMELTSVKEIARADERQRVKREEQLIEEIRYLQERFSADSKSNKGRYDTQEEPGMESSWSGWDKRQEVTSASRQATDVERFPRTKREREQMGLFTIKEVQELIPVFRKPSLGCSWEEYIADFQTTCKKHKVDQMEWGSILYDKLQEEAKREILQLPEGQRTDFEIIMQSLQRKYRKDYRTSQARTDLRNRKQLDGELVSDYVEKMKELARAAYPSNRGDLERNLKESVESGLRDKTMKSRVRDFADMHPRGASNEEYFDYLIFHDPRRMAKEEELQKKSEGYGSYVVNGNYPSPYKSYPVESHPGMDDVDEGVQSYRDYDDNHVFVLRGNGRGQLPRGRNNTSDVDELWGLFKKKMLEEGVVTAGDKCNAEKSGETSTAGHGQTQAAAQNNRGAGRGRGRGGKKFYNLRSCHWCSKQGKWQRVCSHKGCITCEAHMDEFEKYKKEYEKECDLCKQQESGN